MKKLAFLLALLMLLGIFAGCEKKENNDEEIPDEPTESIPYEGEFGYVHAPGEEHVFEAEVLADPDCVKEGQILYMCICGEGYVEKIDAFGHEAEPATCTKAGYCINCNGLVEKALGHTTKRGICERCRAVVD
jgi:hypothetical protein